MIVTLLLLLSISFSAEWNSLISNNSSEAFFSLENTSGSTTTIKFSLDGYYSDDIYLINPAYWKN